MHKQIGKIGATRHTILFLIIGLIVSLLILESLSAVVAHVKGIEKGSWSDRHLYDPYRGHRLNPEFQNSEANLGLKIHSPDGFREDTRVEKVKPQGTFRIIMMGGSALYGLGSAKPYPVHPSLKNNETIDAYLENAINRELHQQGRETKVEIINAAVTGYWTFQHLVYLNESLYQYTPDLVLFLDGHNDFYISRPKMNHWQDYDYSSVHLTDSFNNRRFIFTLYTSVRVAAPYSYFITMLEKVLHLWWERLEAPPKDKSVVGIASLSPSFDDQYAQVAHNSFLRAYSQIQSLSRYYDFKVMFFLQPEIAFENPEVLSPQDKGIRSLTEASIEQSSPGAIASMHRIRSLLPSLFKAHNLSEFHDIAQIGGAKLGSTQLYLDYCHLTPEGSQAVAERLLPFVLRSVLEAEETHGPSKG